MFLLLFSSADYESENIRARWRRTLLALPHLVAAFVVTEQVQVSWEPVSQHSRRHNSGEGRSSVVLVTTQ